MANEKANTPRGEPIRSRDTKNEGEALPTLVEFVPLYHQPTEKKTSGIEKAKRIN